MILPIGSPSALAALFTTMSTPPSWSTVARDEGLELVEVPGVGRHGDRPAARGLDPGRDLLARIGLAARDDDLRAGRGVGLGDGPPDAAASAGDDRDPVGEVVEVEQVLSGAHRHVAHVTRLLESRP